MMETYDVYLAYEETLTMEFRWVKHEGFSLLQQKVEIRYDTNKHRHEWHNIPVVDQSEA